MTLEQRHKAAAERSLVIIGLLVAKLSVQAGFLNESHLIGMAYEPKDVKLADKLVAELLPKTYVLPKAKKRRA